MPLPTEWRCRAGGEARLSTGEKQLLSFARVLCRNPAVLVLDEATAFIDSETETILEEAVEQSFSDKTSIIIAHRLSPVRRADRIVVMDSGRIVEVAPNEVLFARPIHPYTRALLSAAAKLRSDRILRQAGLGGADDEGDTSTDRAIYESVRPLMGELVREVLEARLRRLRRAPGSRSRRRPRRRGPGRPSRQ